MRLKITFIVPIKNKKVCNMKHTHGIIQWETKQYKICTKNYIDDAYYWKNFGNQYIKIYSDSYSILIIVVQSTYLSSVVSIGDQVRLPQTQKYQLVHWSAIFSKKPIWKIMSMPTYKHTNKSLIYYLKCALGNFLVAVENDFFKQDINI